MECWIFMQKDSSRIAVCEKTFFDIRITQWHILLHRHSLILVSSTLAQICQQHETEKQYNQRMIDIKVFIQSFDPCLYNKWCDGTRINKRLAEKIVEKHREESVMTHIRTKLRFSL